MAKYSINEESLVGIADKTRALSGRSDDLTIAEIIEVIDLEKTYLDATLAALTDKGVEVPEGTTNAGLADLIINAEFGDGSVNSFPEFTYTGTYSMIDDGVTDEGVQNWRIKFLTSGTLVFTKKLGLIDVFLVGGGGGGSTSGGGAGGGYTKTLKNQSVEKETEYVITIGSGGTFSGTYGGSGGTTSAFNAEATGGQGGQGIWGGSGGSGGGGSSGWEYTAGGNGGSNGKNGGSGRNGNDNSEVSGGTGQGSTTREFEEKTGDLYAGGGGGGAHGTGTGGSGGSGGGGDGKSATSGTDNTGGGGGGGSGNGSGGSGIVIIRNTRTSA